MEEFERKNAPGSRIRVAVKRKFDEIRDKEDEREAKRTRVEELFYKLTSCKETMTPMRLISLTSPDKGLVRRFKSVTTTAGLKVPKFNTTTGNLLNPRTKSYKMKKIEIQRALKEWEKHLNQVNSDPAPITVENNVDLEGPPENFEYINDYKSGPGIEIPNDPPIGCECEDCGTKKSECCPSQFGVEYAYYKHKRLRITPGRPIYECNKRCKCGPDCSNRVVQQGRKHKVCIFRTKNGRGWGVKALQKIKSGSFVMEYVGEVRWGWYTSRRYNFNFYQLLKWSMSSSSMIKQVKILHQRRNFLFEVILSTLCLFLMTTGSVGVCIHSNGHYVL